MSYLGWMALCGAVLLAVALASAYIRHMPVTTSALYLALGVLIGPAMFGLIGVNFVEQKVLFEHLTEFAVIASLFVSGIKLRLPFGDPAWTAAFRLAGPVMVATIIGIAAFVHLALGLSWPISFLLGAILAPTDPVLASTVSVNDAADKDRMRYGLSGEAGFNDGAAFPFVVFALAWLEFGEVGAWVGEWALYRLAWAVPAGLLFGFFLGKGVGRLSIWLRSRHAESGAPNDFLALSLIAIAYVGAEAAGAWGFLSVFAAGLGFRHAEIKVTEENPLDDSVEPSPADESESHRSQAPAEELVSPEIDEESLRHPVKAGGLMLSEIISFGDTLERLLEIMLVVLVGICLSSYWDWRAIPLALALFFVLRPVPVFLFLAGTPTNRYQRAMMAWFGIRGIGSLYYLSYALNHGLDENVTEVAALTLSVVALSILVHGISSQPALNFYERFVTGKAP
jgi:sodium/hydrogen antiporter